jgi:hypothetical protein
VNPRNLIGAALAGAIAVSTVAAASAQTVTVPYPVYNGGSGYNTTGQVRSNDSVARVAKRVEKVIGNLQRDARDYGGHRVAAINDLSNARNELLAAEQFAQTHGYGSTVTTNPIVRAPRNGMGGRRNETRSAYSVANERMRVQKMIGKLEKDNRDYGGHRVAAINWMQQAGNELLAAQQFDTAHPY